MLDHPLRGTVTVQDPCHASGLEPSTIANVRLLMEASGPDVVELEPAGAIAGCCGLGASMARYRLTDMARTGFHRIRQTGETGARMTCAWCNGCHMVMNMFHLLFPLISTRLSPGGDPSDGKRRSSAQANARQITSDTSGRSRSHPPGRPEIPQGVGVISRRGTPKRVSYSLIED